MFQQVFLVFGSKELGSNEGTTQGDPNTMVVYGIASTLFLKHLVACYAERDPNMIVQGGY